MLNSDVIKNMQSEISNMKLDLAVKKDRLNKLKLEREELEAKMEDLNIDLSEKASIALQKLSKQQRDSAKVRLEELGTQALKYSISDKYRMIIKIDEVRKRPSATVIILDEETGIETNPLDDNGGGIVDIISIALRIVMLQSITPIIDGPIILDEPFKMVSRDYVPMLSDFLLKVCKDFNRQIIVVTHNEYLAESCTNKIRIE